MQLYYFYLVKILFKYSSILLLVAILGIMLPSCQKKDAKDTKDPYADVQGNYFSIRQYALDQWNTFQGEPFTIVKTVKINDNTDSNFTTSDTLNWGNIFKVFFETDISDRKFLGQYTFTQFDDNADGTHNFYYKANDLDLFTQKLLITIDQLNNKVKGIYIETYKKTLWDECKQTLLYAPMHTIQIQTDDKPIFGAKKYSVVQYTFMR